MRVVYIGIDGEKNKKRRKIKKEQSTKNVAALKTAHDSFPLVS